MADNAVEEGARYWAFISYSHVDAEVGRRLHRKLERYVLPRRLVGRITKQGALVRRLAPIFRDRDELPAANDLSAEVHAALKASKCLIVVCSPASAASRWVSREVETFRALKPNAPVLAALLYGTPKESFPSALRELGPSGSEIEPLAADFQETGDGPRLGLLKLVAGIAGVGLDELVQRDAQRRVRRVMAVTGAALVAMLGMGVATGIAVQARMEADRQRGEAEGLIEFMLTDLRSSLKGVGRLDTMTAVNERALRYYSNADLSVLPPDSLERRARIIHAMGEDDESRGAYRAASAKFLEARRTTAALLGAKPNDPERLFNHAQSVFWVGHVAFLERRYAEARVSFEEYSRLADRMLAIEPHNPRYLREKGYAEGNLCSVDLYPPPRPIAALQYCKTALRYMETAARRLPKSVAMTEDLINRHAWLADAYNANKDRDGERRHRRLQERLLLDLMRADPKNMKMKSKWISAQRSLAGMEADEGETDKALERLHKALIVSDQMIAFDPENKAWVLQRKKVEGDISHISHANAGK